MSLVKLKYYNTDDTIAAIATFTSKSALGVIKISGKNAISIIHKIFIPRRSKDIRKAKTYTLHYGWIVDRAQGTGFRVQEKKIIDEVLVSVMREPFSYTCEDVVEISCHGGAIVLGKILEAILKEGARLAQPGEFTYRAFLNGRIDLLQAEGIKNIVDAKTDKALQAAVSQLKGRAFEKFNKIKAAVKDAFLALEADINFPDDDTAINVPGVKEKIKRIISAMEDILKADKEAKIIKEGLICAICGKTNAGKSTLFNALLQEERVIVSEVPGTTRDVIEETINIRGIPLRIHDTAGILSPRNFIEKKAIEKSEKIFNEADLVILVLDGSRRLSKDDLFLLNKIKKLRGGKNTDSPKGVVVIINKSDLKQKLNLKNISHIKGFRVKLSALKKEGIEDLEKVITKAAASFSVKRDDFVFLNRYQSEILGNAYCDIKEAEKSLAANREIDAAAISLKNALENLGKLSGEVFCEELLESIFNDFCIGK
ncbi:MAG: tRNA uridine-5-carboxymethylaminomethyl(34) synthesis GTPase MnmE [Candidatus Omnitrophica bacterium]|nr:tRNA uridine-5-carboxymethylaminomethyl(34) synthesis GTPase MnmE [Candidatus Omnitrophota bacterium]